MKRIFLGILVALFMIGCSTEEVATTPEQDMSFLEPSEQARLWEAFVRKKQKEQPQAQAKNDYAICEYYGSYVNIKIIFEGGHDHTAPPNYRNLARFFNVYNKRYEYYLANQPEPGNPCPEFRIPSSPNLQYDPVNDVYTEVWEEYIPGGDIPKNGRSKRVSVESNDNTEDEE